MDSDMETTSEDHSTSESSSDSSDEDEKLESTQICDVRLQLPQGLCERKEIFDEFFSATTWNALSDVHKQHLKGFLPTFPDNDEQEKNITLQKLFNREVFRFNSPLEKFHEHLKAGHYRPDILKMRNAIQKAERKEFKFRHNLYRQRLKREVIESRNKLLALVRNLPPGVEPKMDRLSQNIPSYVSPIDFRTKRRYFRELASIKEQFEEHNCSSDENYPEGPPLPLSRKLKRHLNTIKSSASNTETIMSTILSKPNVLDLERLIIPNYNPFCISEEIYKNLLLTHKRRRMEDPKNAELDTSGITLFNIINRTDLASFKKLNVTVKQHHDSKPHKKKIKRETPPLTQSPDLVNKISPLFGHSSQSEMDSDSDSILDTKVKSKKMLCFKPLQKEIKIEPVDIEMYNSSDVNLVESKPCIDVKPFSKVVPATLSDLDGIDMMNLPIDLDDTNIDVLEFDNRPELMQDTHANFLCLVRDIICSTTDHRMSMKVLEERLRAWQENPISPLNDWYSLSNNWIALLPLAVDFLSGNCSEQPEDFVPYIEYKTKINMYQWIGAGRDSDAQLVPLSQFWLDHRSDMTCSTIIKDREDDVEVSDRSQTPPPPRCPTTWSIRKASSEEIKSYQEQECRRYSNPHKAFTFKCNGYESIVGPIKGVYNHQNAVSAKARGHSVLNAERPNYVTILTLVRDATARLPNGEGTRADICELLKSSQYINPKVPDSSLQSVVSGALDRMHTQFDPCVKYDSKRKVWIYLHRNRSEVEFEKIHQHYQGVNKTPKKPVKVKTKLDKPSIKPIDVFKTEPISQQSPEPQLSFSNKLTTLLEQPPEINNQKKPVKPTPQPQVSLPVNIENVSNEVQIATSTLIKYPKPNNKNVKIIPANQGKSLILPSVLHKPDELQLQQILEIGSQKVLVQQKQQGLMEQKVQTKIALPVQQPIVQASGRLQSVKGITILKSTNQSTLMTSTFSQSKTSLTNDSIISSSSLQPSTTEQIIQNKNQARLTMAQQQQILHTLKQKILPSNQTITSAQYRAVTKPRVAGTHVLKQVQPVTNTTIEQSKLSSTDVVNSKPIISSQTPLVAKVLTNAAGQVISVESLLAHQKQHGSLPHGTTLRISGTKGGQANLIQLSAPSTQTSATQFVGTPNISTITNQAKVIQASEIIASSGLTPTTKSVMKSATKTTPKVIPRITQQLVSAKFIAQNVGGHKVVQPKVLVGSQNQIKIPVSSKSITTSKTLGINVGSNTGTIRMVNASNLNLAQLGGKPLLISSKGNTFQSLQGQNIILQTEANTSNQGLIISSNAKTIANHQTSNAQHAQVIISPSLKVQQTPRVVLSSAIKPSSAQSSSSNQLVLGGQTVRLHPTGTTNQHRVVLAGQNQGQIITQQILLPVGFQGTPFNLKTLQGLKVVPLATQGKGMQGRQVFARIMNPTNIVRVTQSSENVDVGNLNKSTAE